MDKKPEKRLPYLDVTEGDVVIFKKGTKEERVGYVHEKSRMFHKAFIVTWYDDPENKTMFSSRRTQQDLVKTGENINDEED